ncbi:MAG: hypothetical protein AAFX99_31460, partial [Myxococcota bacterium]
SHPSLDVPNIAAQPPVGALVADEARTAAVASAISRQASEAEVVRQATFERDGKVVEAAPGGSPTTGLELAARYADDLNEDATVSQRSEDAPERLTAAAEALELVLGQRPEAEGLYRKAMRLEGDSRQAYSSLRRLHRAQGNWRTVAQLFDQELKGSDEPTRRAQIQLLTRVLTRTRTEAGITRVGPEHLPEHLPATYNRLMIQLQASKALADRDVEQALRLRRALARPDADIQPPRQISPDLDAGWSDPNSGDALPIVSTAAASDEDAADRTAPNTSSDDEVSESSVADVLAAPNPYPEDPEALAAFQEWTWSEANLRRFLLDDPTEAMNLLLEVFASNRRDPELLDSLAELLTEHGDWERLRSVLTSAVDEGCATSADYEALASLLERRYRDLPAAIEVLKASIVRYPSDPVLARRLAESLTIQRDADSLIDALGNLLNVTTTPADRADLLWRMGRLFDQETCMTSAAIEVLHEAIAALPHHGPTLRALGRIYLRQNNLYGLADLYEKELAAPGQPPEAWRRHYQLAELYELRLHNNLAALRHYRQVLSLQPAFRPALDAVVRVLSLEGDWEELTGLLIELARANLSRRNLRWELLEQAARICEERLGDDAQLHTILTMMVSGDAEASTTTGAFAAMARLYTRRCQWEELISLYERQAGFVVDSDDAAVFFWRCGRVAEAELGDPRRAEDYYRQALTIVPDFVSALG